MDCYLSMIINELLSLFWAVRTTDCEQSNMPVILLSTKLVLDTAPSEA